MVVQPRIILCEVPEEAVRHILYNKIMFIS